MRKRLLEMEQHDTSGEFSGYWAMTSNERDAHDIHLLDAERLRLMSSTKRKSYLDMLHVHTLIGSDITLRMLRNPSYATHVEHLQDVLNSFSRRQERLLRLLEDNL